ncbi:DUF2971 domain-containing protein, partial [Providencia vermicola]|uniref:DUF2971 domain-containing protein n=1 Tax=Providencia vermicola TaxID=333965 RepID=UPI0034E55F0E
QTTFGGVCGAKKGGLALHFGLESAKTFTDELLWAHYADSHNGFCIEYDLDKLCEFEDARYSIFDVIYQNKPPIINVDDIFASDAQNEVIQILVLSIDKK